jgi:hypothetical protein
MTTNFQYSLTDLENMLPWEREIYVAMLLEKLREDNDRIKNKNHG